MSTLRAMTFDLWNTLLASPAVGGAERHRMRVAALADALAASGHIVSADAISAMMKREWTHYNEVWRRESRTLLNAERVAWMTRALEVGALSPERVADVARAFDASLWEGPPPLADGADEALDALQAAGVRLGVISDTSFSTGRTLRRLLADYGVLDAFESTAMVFSDEMGASKPDRALFEEALGALDAQPGLAAHIGDNPHTDVFGAQNAGMIAIYFGRDEVDADLSFASFVGMTEWVRREVQR